MELNFFVYPFFNGAPLLWPLLLCLLLVLALVFERRWRLLMVLGEQEAGAVLKSQGAGRAIALLRRGSGVLMVLTVLAGPTAVVAQSPPSQAPNRPPLIEGPAMVSVWFAENDTAQVGAFTATDPDGDGITWVLAGGDAGAFRVRASSGVLQFASTPNYEASADTDADNVYGVWVIAQDDGTPSQADSVSVAVTVSDVDDLGMLTLSSSSPQVGMAMTATLADEDEPVSKIRWTWQRRVDVSSAWVDIPSSSADSYTPVHEDVGYQLRAKVKYNDYWGTDKKVTKKAPQQVVGVPGPPALSAEPGDGQVGLRWTAPASDGGRAITGYEYWYSGVGADAWSSVDGGSAADNLTVRSLTNGQEYTFAVRAVNKLGAGLADSTQATPQASNRPPLIGGPASVSVSFAENDTVQVSTFTATDPEGDGIAWVLAGDDAGAFTLGASSGVLQFASAPNYEVPSDTDADNVYGVWVIAQDDGTPSEADSVSVAVTVTDGDDLGTLTLSSSSPQVGVAMTATLTDEDGSVSKIRWTWQRRVDVSSAWVDIPSSSADSYTPVREDVGYQLRAKVKYNDPWGKDKKVTKKAPQKVVDVPGPPVLSAEPGDGQVGLRWTAPASDGGRPITGYEYWYSDAGGNAWTSVDGGASADNLTVSSLTNGQEYTFAVRAVNALGAGLADSTQATPQASNRPPSIGGPASVSVSFAENDTSAVSTFTATDPEGDGIAWVLAGDDADAFTLGASSGVLQFASAPNYEVPSDTDADNVYGVWVIAQDDGTSSEADSVSVAVTVTDGDDLGTLTLSSSSPQVGVAMTATLTDEDGSVSKIRWTWQRRVSASADWVDIPSSSAVSYTPVRADVGYQLRAKVKYNDPWGTDKKVTQKASQQVVDVPGPPALSAEPGDGQVALRWTAPANDGGRSITGYEYWYSGVGADAWSSVDGGASADSLTISSLTNGQEYTFAVRAVNELGAGLADSTQATPQASNRPPSIGGPASVSVSFAENDTSAVSTFTATDPDDDGIAWVLAGDDADAFTLGASSGVLQFASAPNYEVPSDTDADNVYGVWVIAQDDGTPSEADSVSVAVTVTDGDDLGTVTLSSSSPQVGVAMTATLTDEDGSVSKIRWTWQRRVDASADWVDIPSSSADSYTPVREDVGYQLRARVKYNDPWGADKKVPQKAPQQVVDVPGPPALSAKPGDGQMALRWTAPASDGGRAITGYEYWYSDAGADAWSAVDGGASADNLTIRSLTNGQEYTFAVRAVNELGAGLADSTQATPQVPNHPPLIGGPATVSVSFAENDTVQVSTFTATDPEGDGITWVLAGDDASAFRVGASSGVLQFASAPNYEAPSDTDTDNVYQVWVIAQDDGTPSQADSVSVAVTVTAVDEPGTLTLSSSSPQEGVPLTVTLHDEDGLLSVQFTQLGIYKKASAAANSEAPRTNSEAPGTNSWAPVSTTSGAIGPDTVYVFIPDAGWVGFQLKVKATYTDQHGAKTKSTPWTDPVLGTTVEDTGTVSLSSMSPQVRVPLTATLTDPSGGIYEKKWTWQRRSGSTASWADIPSSSDSSYTPVDGDMGYQLRATVSYRDLHGAALDRAQSAATAGVQANVPCAPALSASTGDGQVTLSWIAPTCDGGSSITHYQYRQQAGSWMDVSGDGSKREHIVSDLTNGTLYTFAVRAVNAVGAGAASNDASATPETVGTVSLTSTSPRVGVAVTATLTDPDGVATRVHWTWQRRSDSSASWADIPSSNAASYTPVVGDVGYQLRVTASYRDMLGNNQDSAQSAATAGVQGVPSAPRNLQASAQSSSQIRLTWDAPLSNGGATITGYQYRWQRQGGSWTEWSNVSGGGSARSRTVSGLSSSTSYTFQVRAVNKVGNGATAQTTRTTQTPSPSPPPPELTCNAPSNLSTESVGLGYFELKLTWDPPIPNCNPTSYQYRQRPQRGTWIGDWTEWSSVSSPYTASGLDSGTRYTFEVRAHNAAGSGSTASIIRDTRAKLVAPSLLAAPDSVLAAISAPNPFNPSTTLHVQLPTSGPVSLILYNLSGQVVRTAWVEHYLEAGVHLWQWDGRDDQGRLVASGVYLYVLRASDQTLMQKVTLLR